MQRLALSVAVLALVCGVAGCPSTPPGGNLTFGVDAHAHDQFFPITSGEKHALGLKADDGPISCDSCHKGTNTFTEFSCVGCHEHRQDLIDGIHGGITNYRYLSASCLQCHPRGNADNAINDAQHTQLYFPIDNGSAHAATQCSGCHTNAADRKVVNCTGCHDASKTTAGAEEHDSVAMQAVHGTLPGYAWDTPTCLTCHARSENPGKFDHTAYFPTQAGSKHEAVTCKECHADVNDRTRLSCTTCHDHAKDVTDTQHVGVPEYSYDSGSCYMCHQQSQVPGVIQHTFFPIDPGTKHALGTFVDNLGDSPNVTIACATCHTDPNNKQNVACTSCHVHSEPVLAPTHTPLGADYTWTNTACVFCHPHSEPTGLINHPYFPIAAGDVHNPTVATCSTCHASNTDRTLLQCATCHTSAPVAQQRPIDAPHAGMPGYSLDSAACFTCHAQSQVPGAFDHVQYFPVAAGDKHGPVINGIVCIDCHADRANRKVLNCTACHLGTHDKTPMDAGHVGIPNYSWSPASCYGCHPNGTAAGAVFSHPFFPITAADTHGKNGIVCADCHTTPGDNTKVECIACHLGSHDQTPMNTRHAAVPGFQWATTQCLFCHPHSEPSGNIDHAAFFPIAAPAKHAGIACVDCHIDPNNRKVLACAQCHANDNPPVTATHAGIPNFANTSPACLTCHPKSEPIGQMDHLPFFPISAGTKHQAQTCVGCHASRTVRSNNLCATCHTALQPTINTLHSRVKGYANASPNCKQCHADSQVNLLSAHTAFSPSHHGAKCIDCHRVFRTDTKPFGINFAIGDCVRCHSANCTPSNHNGC